MSIIRPIHKDDKFYGPNGEPTTAMAQGIAVLPIVDKLFLAGARTIEYPDRVPGVVKFFDRVKIVLETQVEQTDNEKMMLQIEEEFIKALLSLERQ
jgi:hypothetical protein